MGKHLTDKKSWSAGGNKYTQRNYSDGSSSTTTSRGGRMTNIRDTDSKGRSHDHNVGHGIFGPVKGSRKN